LAGTIAAGGFPVDNPYWKWRKNMNSNRTLSLFVALMMLLSALPLLVPDASGTRWEQTSADDFDDGESFFVDTSGGTLKLSRGLTGIWSDQGEGATEYFGRGVASAGDVNGDGYVDVIVGAYYNDDGGSNAGEAYVYYGSSSGLSATPDWSDQGEAASDRFGYSVASAGDVNGDGYADVIIGAYANDDGGSLAGEAYVYHGSSSGLSATPDWSDQGEAAGDYFGYSVASAGDVNGDGYVDVVVGAYGNDDAAGSAGEAYVYHGSSSGLSATPDWSDQGEAVSNYFGMCVASAGDVNGDGYADVIVGAYGNDDADTNAGEAYVYHGSSSGLSATPDWSDQGEAGGDYFGYSVASAGDVNGDGYADVIVGAYGNDDAASSAGEVYVYYGSSSGLSATPDWSDQGEAATDLFGYSVASAGDVNGDGYADVIVGAYGNDDADTNAGEAYVYHGSSSGLSATPDWSDQGKVANDYFGISVASAGDVNGDGYADVIVSAPYNDYAGSAAGEAYVYSFGVSAAVNAWAQQELTGEGTSNYFGYGVASAGDVNGDGYADVIVGGGAYSSYTGRAYIYHGSSSGIGSSATTTLTGETAGDWFGFSVASAGDVNGDGYADVIVGAYSYDSSADEGRVYIYHGSSSGISSSAARTLTGAGTYYYFGDSVASAGDVNGDGYADVIIGAYGYSSTTGRAYIYHGSSSGISSSSARTLTGETASDSFSRNSVGSAGDVNGDGYDDVIVGAYGNDDGGNSAGKAYVYHGSGTGVQALRDWSDQGETASDQFGWGVASAGDVNGDGYADVIVGAPYNDGADTNAGEAYVYHGSASGLSATPDWSDQGEAANDYFGDSVASAGDVNGDGYADVIIGAYNRGGANGAGLYTGEAYVYHGSSSGLSTSPDWSGYGDVGVYFGGSVASAGDVNGDGYGDLIIGGDRYSSYTGRAYVFHSNGYAESGIFESLAFTLDSTDAVDWLILRWTPSKPQPAGTSVKAQIGTSSDGVTWTWHGPTGSTSNYFTNPAGQAIYSGDRGKFLKVRFYLTSDFGGPGDAKGNGAGSRTPSVESFTIEYVHFTTPTAILTWPNGGENLMHGESYAITWESEGDMSATTPISLDYSLNGGSTWTSITSGTANDGNYLWTLPSNENVERALIRITATALDGSTVQDTSDGTFSIDPPEFWQIDDGDSEDTEPPVITMFPLGTATAGEPITIRAEVSDETSVTQVALRYGDTEPVTVAMSPAGNGVWEVTLLPVEGELELVVIASDGTNVVETQSQTLSVGAASASSSSAGGSTIAMTLVAGTALGLLVGISRRKEL
jgi:hypothetical protein